MSMQTQRWANRALHPYEPLLSVSVSDAAECSDAGFAAGARGRRRSVSSLADSIYVTKRSYLSSEVPEGSQV